MRIIAFHIGAYDSTPTLMRMKHPPPLKHVSKNHKRNRNIDVNRNMFVSIIHPPPLKRITKMRIKTPNEFTNKTEVVSIHHPYNISSSDVEQNHIDATQTKVMDRQFIASKPLHDTNNNNIGNSLCLFSKQASSTTNSNSLNQNCENVECRQIEQENLSSTTITVNSNSDIDLNVPSRGLQRTNNNNNSIESETKTSSEKGIQCELSDEELDIVNGNDSSAQDTLILFSNSCLGKPEQTPVKTTKQRKNSSLEVRGSGNFHVKKQLHFKPKMALKSVTNNVDGKNNIQNVLQETPVMIFEEKVPTYIRLLNASPALVQKGSNSDSHRTLTFRPKRCTNKNICHIKRNVKHSTQFQLTQTLNPLPTKNPFQDHLYQEHDNIGEKGAAKPYESEMDIASSDENRSLTETEMNIVITSGPNPRQQYDSNENILHKDFSDRNKSLSRSQGIKIKPAESLVSNSQCKSNNSHTGYRNHRKIAAPVKTLSDYSEFSSTSSTVEYLPKHKCKEANNKTALHKSNEKKIHLESYRQRMTKKLSKQKDDVFSTGEKLMQQGINFQTSEDLRFNNNISDKHAWKRKWCKLAKTKGNVIQVTKPSNTFEFTKGSVLFMNIPKSLTIGQTPRVLTSPVSLTCNNDIRLGSKMLEFVSVNESPKTPQPNIVASVGDATSRAIISGTDRLLLEAEGTKIICSICGYTHFIECIDFVSRELFCYNCRQLLHLQNCDWSSSNICYFCGQVNRLSIKNGCLPNLTVCCFCSCTADSNRKLYSATQCEEDDAKQFVPNTESSFSTVMVSGAYDQGVCNYGLFMYGEDLDFTSSHSFKTASTDLKNIEIGKEDDSTDDSKKEKCVAMLNLTSLKKGLLNMDENLTESAKNTKCLSKGSESSDLSIPNIQNRFNEASFHFPKGPPEKRLSCHWYSQATEKSSGKLVCSNIYMNQARVISPPIQKSNNHALPFMSQNIPNNWPPLEVGKYSRQSENGCLTGLYSNCSSGTSVTWSCDYSLTGVAPVSSFGRTMSPNRPTCPHSRIDFGSDCHHFVEQKKTSLPPLDSRNETKEHTDVYMLETPIDCGRTENYQLIDVNKVQTRKTDKKDYNVVGLHEGHSSDKCRFINIGKEDQRLDVVTKGCNTTLNCQLNSCKDVDAVERYCSLRKKSLQEKDRLCLLDSSSERPELCVYLDDVQIDTSVCKSLRHVYTSRSDKLSPENKLIKYFGKFVYLDKKIIVSVIKNKLKPAILEQLRQRRKRKANSSSKRSQSVIAKSSRRIHSTSQPSVGNEQRYNTDGEISSVEKSRAKREVILDNAVDSTVPCSAVNYKPRYETTQMADLPLTETVLRVIDSDQLTQCSSTPCRSVAAKTHDKGQIEMTNIESISSIPCTRVEYCDKLKTISNNVQLERDLFDDATQQRKSKDKCPELGKQEQAGFHDYSFEMVRNSCNGHHSQDNTTTSLFSVNFGLISDISKCSCTPYITYCGTSPSDILDLPKEAASLGMISIPPEKQICIETDGGIVKEMATKRGACHQRTEYFTFDLDDKFFETLEEPSYSGTMDECNISSESTFEEFDVTDPEYEELIETEIKGCLDFRNVYTV